jgi:hypothetical protein
VNLGLLIAVLGEYDKARRVQNGFGNPHSYRGYYDELAFEPQENVTVGEMLAACHEADGTTYQGWKGGDYTMGSYSNVYIAHEGSTGDELSERLLRYMLADEAES